MFNLKCCLHTDELVLTIFCAVICQSGAVFLQKQVLLILYVHVANDIFVLLLK